MWIPILGIPYAAPPVGNLRWRPPAPVKKWSDTLDATKPGNSCPQVTDARRLCRPDAASTRTASSSTSTRPAPTARRGRSFVWIHGGGNIDGQSDAYDGAKLATGGPSGEETVVVIMNYRMGLFGYLSHPALELGRPPLGQLRHPRHPGRAPLGAAQRCGLRRRSDQGSARRPVRWRFRTPARTWSRRWRRGCSTALSSKARRRRRYRPSSRRAARRGNATSQSPPAARARDAAAAAACASCRRSASCSCRAHPTPTAPYVTGPHIDGTIIPMHAGAGLDDRAFNKVPIMGGDVQDEGNFRHRHHRVLQYGQAAITAAQSEANVRATYGGNAGPA